VIKRQASVSNNGRKEGNARLIVNRRRFLGSLMTAAATGTVLSGGGTSSGNSLATAGNSDGMRLIRLTTEGGDRATAYGMSGKVVSLHEPYLLCSWLDVKRQNRWAMVDARRGEVVRRGTVGPVRSDNHCGVALCVAPDRTAHCVVGAHGGSFMHYRMSASDDHATWQLIREAVGQGATYPSLVCDGEGTLHLTYRFSASKPYHVMYTRRRKEDVSWSEPRPLVRAAVPVHTWTTHAIEVGPEGRLHLVLTNTQTLPKGAWYYGASHVYSDDSGESWRQLGDGAPLVLPAAVGSLKRIEGDEFHAHRTLPLEDKQRLPSTGPSQYYYFNILLSNPVIDETGCPWVVVHNLLRGEADLYHADENTWTGTPLRDVVSTLVPDHQISHMGQLSRRSDGTLEIVLTVVPQDIESHRYGAAGTKLVRILVDAAKTTGSCELVCQPDSEGAPNWQPNIQRPTGHTTIVRPALLWTRGINSHTLTEMHTNVNEVLTEVWLQVP
jgi:hypothetical protein